jgi:hypothetical protein
MGMEDDISLVFDEKFDVTCSVLLIRHILLVKMASARDDVDAVRLLAVLLAP